MKQEFVWITNELYGAFVAATGHRVPSYWINGKIPAGSGGFPVTFVSAIDADAYCAWVGKRLPTDAEAGARGVNRPLWLWEWTATSKEKNRVVWGGSWINYELNLRAAYRHFIDPAFRFNIVGFRCSR